jgi:type IV secretory pathway VirB2 component (pilin)
VPLSGSKTGLAASTSLTGFILTLIQILLSFAGLIAVVMVILGGYWYMAAGGNEEMSEKGRKTMLNFVMGLAIIIMAYVIVTVVVSTLTGADKLSPQ